MEIRDGSNFVQIEAVDCVPEHLHSAGHVAIAGVVAKLVQQGEGRRYLHKLEFGFEFDPTLLPKVLSGFQAIAEGHG